MFRKAFTTAALVLLAALTLTGCAGKIPENNISGKDYILGKGYIYEKDGFPDKFGIQLYENGEYTYYEGSLSSYIGHGNWKLDGDILILTEVPYNGKSNIFRFKVDGDTLSYIAEGSNNFMYIKVSDGERFTAGELNGFPY